MNLRTVTIWTTGLMLSVTIVVAVSVAHNSYSSKGMGAVMLATCAVWLFTGSPLAVSFIITCKSKRIPPLVVILASIIIYGVFYGWGYTCMESEFAPLSLVTANTCSLSVMIPAWIIVLLLNWRYVTKTPEPGMERSTAVSPAPLE